MKRMLLLVDPQYDFINGALPVPGAARAMDELAEFIADNPGRYDLKTVTLDFHPPTHCSFTGQGGQWPPHCLEYSAGAAIWAPLATALRSSGGPALVLRKGRNPAQEEYSIFKNIQAAQTLLDNIAAREIDSIDICGIAGDICVLNTLMDGEALLGADRFNILGAFSPSLDGGRALEAHIGRRRT